MCLLSDGPMGRGGEETPPRTTNNDAKGKMNRKKIEEFERTNTTGHLPTRKEKVIAKEFS